MKPKYFATLLFLFAFVSLTHAQAPNMPLPSSTFIEHYYLDIGYGTTTVLIFPAAVRPGDKGESDHEFIVQKQLGAENVLKLKAARKNFTSSNLHVFTADGKIYAFDVYYSALPEHTTFDLRKLSQRKDQFSLFPDSRIMFTNTPFDQSQIEQISSRIKNYKPFISKTTRKFEMKLKLQTIFTKGDFTFFSFSIKNKSTLSYPIDFVRTYISSNQKMKRASVQEIEIEPTFKDSISVVEGHTTIKYVVAVPRFTLTDHKTFRIEIFEKNGGRNLSLPFTNRELLKAQPLQ